MPEATKPPKKLTSNEYDDKYDLSDKEVFAQQGEQLSLVEEIICMQGIMFKLAGVKSPDELWAKMRVMYDEGSYFKEHLKGLVLDQK